MKNFFKKASVYLIIMVLVAAVIFSLNYYYAQKMSADIEAEISEFAVQNDYNLADIEVESNLLLEKIVFNKLKLSRENQFNLEVEEANINFSWQRIISYLFDDDLKLPQSLNSDLKNIDYQNLKDNYSLNFTDARIDLNSNLTKSKLKKIEAKSDLELLLENNHQLEFKAAQLKYDFPYHRSYGLNKENWQKLSNFNDFILRADYSKDEHKLTVKEFNLSNQFLKILFNLDSKLVYDKELEKIKYETLNSDYDLYLAADQLDFESTSFFNDLKFKQLDLNGNLSLTNKAEKIKAEEFDLNLKLADLELLLNKSQSQKIRENTFGILAKDDQFKVVVDEFSYQQNYSYPSGSSSSKLNSNIILAESEAEYSLNQEVPYISSAKLRFKTKKTDIEELNLLLQILLSQSFTKDEEGYYLVEFWGSIDNLNFE